MSLFLDLTNFLSHYLAGQRNLSPNTIKAYRDTFMLLLRFCRDVKGIPLEKLGLEHINVVLVEAFLGYLEKERNCKARTLNHRLATLHAFFRRHKNIPVNGGKCLVGMWRLVHW